MTKHNSSLHDLGAAAGATGHPGVLATLVALAGFLAAAAWFAWRFGPALARVCGFCSWWVAWGRR